MGGREEEEGAILRRTNKQRHRGETWLTFFAHGSSICAIIMSSIAKKSTVEPRHVFSELVGQLLYPTRQPSP